MDKYLRIFYLIFLNLLIFVGCTEVIEEVKVVEEVKVIEEVKVVEISELLNSVNGIVDPYNLEWPRSIIALNGLVEIKEQPERILTISVGHDEMLLGFVDTKKIVATSSFSQDPNSNVFEITKGLPIITSEIETIIAQNPDLVFADPYAKIALIETLTEIGITVIQTELHNDTNGRIDDILLAAYATGELESSFELISLISNKVNYINNFKRKIPKNETKKVLAVTYYDAYWVGGEGSTEGSIIELSGGVNVAAQAGVVSNNMITKEVLISMEPDVIIIPQSVKWGGQSFYDDLKSDETLKEIPAIKNNEVYRVPAKYFTTLSHWNIRGVEELMKILWNDPKFDLNLEIFGDFKQCLQCDFYEN